MMNTLSMCVTQYCIKFVDHFFRKEISWELIILLYQVQDCRKLLLRPNLQLPQVEVDNLTAACAISYANNADIHNGTPEYHENFCPQVKNGCGC